MGQYCITNPSSSYTSTLYKITCQGWTDLDGIKDYFLHSKNLFKVKKKRKQSLFSHIIEK
jgi:hypothetical protein